MYHLTTVLPRTALFRFCTAQFPPRSYRHPLALEVSHPPFLRTHLKKFTSHNLRNLRTRINFEEPTCNAVAPAQRTSGTQLFSSEVKFVCFSHSQHLRSVSRSLTNTLLSHVEISWRSCCSQSYQSILQNQFGEKCRKLHSESKRSTDLETAVAELQVFINHVSLHEFSSDRVQATWNVVRRLSFEGVWV